MSGTERDPGWLAGGFQINDIPTAEIDRIEAHLVPLTEAVRDLIDVTIRTTVDLAEVNRAREQIETITAALRLQQSPGPAGVQFNQEGRAWQWGNAAVGARNAVAPPLEAERGADGIVRGRAQLGAAYEGPPGKVHGGVLALILDHLMGVTASDGYRSMMTGTLTLRYRRATPLGPVELTGWIDREEGVKAIVRAQITVGGEVTVEAEGIFIQPRWARSGAVTQRQSPAPSSQ